MLVTIAHWLVAHGRAGLVPFLPRSGIAYALATIIVTVVAARRWMAAGIPERRVLVLITIMCAGLAIGPRLYILLITPSLWLTPAHWLSAQGVASWGGYLGVGAGALAYCRLSRPAIPMSRVFDAGFSCAALAEVIARGACMLNGDDFGVPTTLPWGIRFLPTTLAYNAHVAAGLIPAGAPASLPVHPLPIYLSFAALIAFIITTRVWRRYGHVPWLTFGTFLLTYGALRFPLELLRDPSQGGPHGVGLSAPQLMCLGAIAVGGAIVL